MREERHMGGGYSQLAPLKVNTKLPMTDPLVVIMELVWGGGMGWDVAS